METRADPAELQEKMGEKLWKSVGMWETGDR
jgi:hypothetical protein